MDFFPLVPVLVFSDSLDDRRFLNLILIHVHFQPQIVWIYCIYFVRSYVLFSLQIFEFFAFTLDHLYLLYLLRPSSIVFVFTYLYYRIYVFVLLSIIFTEVHLEGVRDCLLTRWWGWLETLKCRQCQAGLLETTINLKLKTQTCRLSVVHQPICEDGWDLRNVDESQAEHLETTINLNVNCKVVGSFIVVLVTINFNIKMWTWILSRSFLSWKREEITTVLFDQPVD